MDQPIPFPSPDAGPAPAGPIAGGTDRVVESFQQAEARSTASSPEPPGETSGGGSPTVEEPPAYPAAAAWMRAVQDRTGLALEDIAARSGVRFGTVAAYRAGSSRPNPANRARIEALTTGPAHPDIARWISDGLARTGLTQAALAKRVGMQAHNLSHIARGHVLPLRATMDKIAAVLGPGPLRADPPSAFAAWLSDRLRERDMTIARAAEACGCRLGTFRLYLRGTRPLAAARQRIRAVFGEPPPALREPAPGVPHADLARWGARHAQRLGLTAAALGRAVGVSASTAKCLLAGRQYPRRKTMSKLVELFGEAPPDAVLGSRLGSATPRSAAEEQERSGGPALPTLRGAPPAEAAAPFAALSVVIAGVPVSCAYHATTREVVVTMKGVALRAPAEAA